MGHEERFGAALLVTRDVEETERPRLAVFHDYPVLTRKEAAEWLDAGRIGAIAYVEELPGIHTLCQLVEGPYEHNGVRGFCWDFDYMDGDIEPTVAESFIPGPGWQQMPAPQEC